MKKLTKTQLTVLLMCLVILPVAYGTAVLRARSIHVNNLDILTENVPVVPEELKSPQPLETTAATSVTKPTVEELPGLTPEQKQRAEHLTSLFENGKINIQYDYVENLDDGRGYTSGRAGFTTADGDAYKVVLLYTEIKPDNSLAKYLPILKKLADDGSDSVKELSGYAKAWRDSASVKEFKSAQDSIVDREYFGPSQSYADMLGLKLAISRAFLYDTIIQHGDGKDADSISALIKITNERMGGSPKDDKKEVDWLSTFIDVRKEVLKHPHNAETRDEWRVSTGRCDVYRQILEDRNYVLGGPINIKTSEYKVIVP